MTTEKEVLHLVTSLEAELKRRVGTPSTLRGAIANAFTTETLPNPKELLPRTIDDVEKHVKDFLAQKFQLFRSGDGGSVDTAMLALWEKVIKHDE